MLDIRLLSVYKYFYSHIWNQVNEVLSGISLDINQGDFIIITGPSGSGKTTLLMTLGGLLIPEEGTLYYNKNVITKLNSFERDRIRGQFISYIFQDNLLLNELTVLENILFPFQIKQEITKEVIKKALYYMELLGIYKLSGKNIISLSGGEQQLVKFIRGVLPDFSILLADEPTSELDNALSLKVFDFLKKINREKNVSIVCVSHFEEAKKFAKDFYKMEKGKLTGYVKLN